MTLGSSGARSPSVGASDWFLYTSAAAEEGREEEGGGGRKKRKGKEEGGGGGVGLYTLGAGRLYLAAAVAARRRQPQLPRAHTKHYCIVIPIKAKNFLYRENHRGNEKLRLVAISRGAHKNIWTSL